MADPVPTTAAATSNRLKVGANGQHHDSGQREAHAHSQCVRHGPPIGIEPDEGLQQAGDHLIGEREQADLPKVQMKRTLENGIDGGQQRLHHVIEQMAEADRDQNANDNARRGWGRAW